MKKYIVIIVAALAISACGKRSDFNNQSATNASQSISKETQYQHTKHSYISAVTGGGGIVYYGYRDRDNEIQFYSFIGKSNGTYYALNKNGSLLFSCSGECYTLKRYQFLAAPVYPKKLKEYLNANKNKWSDSLNNMLSSALKANNILVEYASTRTDFGNYTIAGGVMHDATSGYMKPMEMENGGAYLPKGH